jgi:hypothetical protein
MALSLPMTAVSAQMNQFFQSPLNLLCCAVLCVGDVIVIEFVLFTVTSN